MVRRVLYRGLWFLDYLTSFGGRIPLPLTRFLRYVLSSGSMVVLDLFILGLLTEYAGIHYLISVAISFTTSNSLNYSINRCWSFEGTKTHPIEAYFYFLLFGLFGLTLTILLMHTLVTLGGVHYLFARIIVYILEGSFGFLLNSVITFRIPLKTKRNSLKRHYY